jgi:hypothetical protein
MTDYEKMKALLNEFDIGYTEDIFDYQDYPSRDNNIIYKDAKNITLTEGDKNVGGYFGFCTVFSFTSEGKFIKVGAFE